MLCVGAQGEACVIMGQHLSDFFVRVQDGVGVVHFSRDGEWNIYGLSECFLRQNLPTFDAVFQPL